MAKKGQRDISKLSEGQIAALGSPIIIRGMIVNELVRHGVMKPEAAETMGIDRVLELAYNVEPGVQHISKVRIQFQNDLIMQNIVIEIENIDLSIDKDGKSYAHFQVNDNLTKYVGREGVLEYAIGDASLVLGGTLQSTSLFSGARPIVNRARPEV